CSSGIDVPRRWPDQRPRVLDSHGGGRYRTGRFDGVASDWRCTIHLPGAAPDDGEADGGVACVAGGDQVTDGIGVAIDADGDGELDRRRPNPGQLAALQA